MDASEQVKVVAATLLVLKGTAQSMKKMLEEMKVAIEESKVVIKPKIKAVLENLENEVEKRIVELVMKNKMKQLDILMESSEENSVALVELVKVIDTLLREVHEPPSLVNLVAGRVVEEGLGVGELPTTLKEKVAGLPNDRQVKALKALFTMGTVIEQARQMFKIVVEFHKAVLPNLQKWFV